MKVSPRKKRPRETVQTIIIINHVTLTGKHFHSRCHSSILLPFFSACTLGLKLLVSHHGLNVFWNEVRKRNDARVHAGDDTVYPRWTVDVSFATRFMSTAPAFLALRCAIASRCAPIISLDRITYKFG